MDKQNIVILGGCSCGSKAAARLKRIMPDAHVTLVERGESISYDRWGFPQYIGSTIKDVNDLMRTTWDAIRTPELFKSIKGVDTLIGCEATEIHRTEKEVIIRDVKTKNMNILPYDKLVFATGAQYRKPSINHLNADGIFEIKTPQDSVRLQEYLKNGVESAVILGSGFWGLQLAEAIANWGVQITIIESKDHIFPMHFDSDIAAVVQDYLEKEDINIIVSTDIIDIKTNDNNQISQIITNNGILDCDLLLYDYGLIPEVQLAEEAGLTVNQGIVVNEYLQTSDPDIYAGGDCVRVLNRVSGELVMAPMGDTSNKHGRIIATNIAQHDSQKYTGIIGSALCPIFDWKIGKVGITSEEAIKLGFDIVSCIVPGPDISHFIPGKKLVMMKTIADKTSKRILGVQIVGPGHVDKRVDAMAAAMSMNPKMTALEMANLDLAYSVSLSPAVDNIHANANVIQNEIDGYAHSYDFFETMKKLKDDNVIFVDLRIDEEVEIMPFETKNYYHIPLEELSARVNELPRNREIVVFCVLCTRGVEGQTILERAGFKNVHFIKGGILFWPFEKYLS